MKKLISILLSCTGQLFIACDQSPEQELSRDIQGFWKVRQYQQTGEVNDMYAQINDSIILYWYERINYIFPYSYRLEGDQLIVRLQCDSLSRPTVMGKINRENADQFTLVNEGQRLEYQRIPFTDF